MTRELKELIAEKQREGISQKDIANSTGVNQTFISKLKNGNGNITQENYDKLKEYFGEDFLTGGREPIFVQSSRKPKPLKISQGYHDAAMKFVLNGLDLNGKAIVPNCYRGHEDVLISKLAGMNIEAKFIPNENGGIIEEIGKQESTFDPSEALKVEEVEQPRCEVVDHEDVEDKEPARLRKSDAIDPALAIDHPVFGRAYVLTEEAEPKGLIVNQAFDDLFEDASPAPEPFKTDECGRYYEEEIPEELNEEDKDMADNINHPSHYTAGKIEVIDIIRDITGDKFEGYCLGNVIKYVARYQHKNGAEDLKKAKVYLDWLIGDVERDEVDHGEV